MSILASTIAPAVAPAANVATHGSGSASRGHESGSTGSSIAQNPITSQAAIVQLTSEGKIRAASSGSLARRVDASFEKQEAKKTADSNEDGKKSSQRGKVTATA